MVTPKEETEFWLGYIRAGIVVTIGTLIAVLPYLALVTGDPSRRPLWLVPVGVVIMIVTVRLAPWERLIAGGKVLYALYAWSAATVLAIIVAIWIDGGHLTPLRWLLLVPLIYGSMAYPPRAVVVLTAFMMVLDLAVAVVLNEPLGGVVYLRLMSMALVGWMCTASARTHTDVAAKLRRTAVILEDLARIDGLTGCLNHRSFQERLQHEVTAHRRHGDPLSLLLFDLDHFKRINDTYGHPVGDEVLERTGTVLLDAIRSQDVVGRIGGEEFAVLLPRTETSAAVHVAERCRAAVGGAGTPIHVTVSIGVASLPAVATTADELLAAADRGLYQAKRSGRDAVMVTRPRDGHAVTAGTVNDRLGTLLDGHRLIAVFQPLVEIATGHVIGWEALSRVLGSNLAPPEWLALADDNGRRAELEMAMWSAALDAWATVSPPPEQILSLNVSPDVLVDGLPWTLHERFPARTVLEISEHAPVRSYPQLNAALDDWRAAGVAIAIDDVGAGHASLRHVLELRADLLKLDHFLVHDLPTHAPKRALVRSLALFSNEHGGRLVAEGVEDAATAEVLIELGVELGQGWHLGRPGPLTPHEERATSSGVDWPNGEDPATTAVAVYDHDAAAPADHAGRDVASAPARRPHRAGRQGRDE